MSPKKRWMGIIALLVVVSMLLAACQPTVAPTTAPQATEAPKPTEPPVAKEKVLRVNIGTYPDTIDPQRSSYVNEIGHEQLIYEGLTKFNTKLETIPGAAEKWEYNADATELTFTLREGLKYSDGTLLNAMRFEYSLTRNINPETAGEYAGITDFILGAPEWRSADPEDAEAMAAAAAVVDESIQAYKMDGTTPCEGYEDADCRILKIKMSAPTPYAHTVLGIWVGFPAKEENIAEGGENWWNGSKYQIGNGPYILKTLEPFVRARFIPNPNYWDKKAIVDIEYSYITDGAISFQAYLNNEFDIVPLGAEDYLTVMADEQLMKEANIYPGSCTFAMQFNQKKEPFSDPAVRKAFSMALDREAWVADVLNNLGAPAYSWIPPGIPGANPNETRWRFDPAAAKAMLESSTYGSAENLPEITATFGDTPRGRLRWEWIAANLKENLGVEIKLDPIEPTTFTALTKSNDTYPQMMLLGWCSDYPDPQNWLSTYWTTTAGFAVNAGFSNPEFDAICAEADKTVDPDARMALYQKAQDMLIDILPAVMFWHNVNSYMVKPWVLNIEKTPQDATFPGFYAPNLIDIDTSMLP